MGDAHESRSDGICPSMSSLRDLDQAFAGERQPRLRLSGSSNAQIGCIIFEVQLKGSFQRAKEGKLSIVPIRP